MRPYADGRRRQRAACPSRSTSRDRPIAASVGIFKRHVRGDVAERVAALVLVQRGIRQFADADAVENDDDARANTASLRLRRRRSRPSGMV